MPPGVRDFHARADVDAEAERALQRHRLLADHLAAERVRGEVLHRDGVVALDEQEVVDADDVLVRDLARVAQLVHETLHDLFVFRDVRVQELEDEALVDHGVFHEQHGAERALADAFDVLVAAFDDVAGLERLDVELLRPRHLFGFLHRALHVLLGHELRAGLRGGGCGRCGRRRRNRRRCRGARRRNRSGGTGVRRSRGLRGLCGPMPHGRGGRGQRRAILRRREPRATAREARVELGQRAQRRLRHGLFGVGGLGLDLHADVFEPAFVGELGQRGDGLEPDLFFLARQHRQHRVDDLVVAEAAERAHHHRQGARGRGAEHFDQARHRAFAADFGERIHGAFADPPILVLGGFDEVTDRAVVLGLVEDLDRGAADVLVLVADQLQARPRPPSVRRSCRARPRRGCAPTSRRRTRPRAAP